MTLAQSGCGTSLNLATIASNRNAHVETAAPGFERRRVGGLEMNWRIRSVS